VAHGAGVDPLFLRTAAAMGDGLILIAAPVLLAIVVAVVCRAMSGTHLIHHWVAVSGYVVAALLLVGWTWFPMMLFFLWALVVGIALALPHPQAERSREAMTEPHRA
jgi:chromate transport protein ChrA